MMPIDTAGVVQSAVRAASSNLDDLRRAMAAATQQPRPVNYSPGVAGHAHAQPCQICKPQPGGVVLVKCRCVERCSWPHCKKTIVRTDPVLYSEGVVAPPVPTFRKEASHAA